MSLAFGLALPHWYAISGGAFSPASLFAGGTVAGAWYDPSDLSTMFITSAGTTQCAMPGQGSAVSVGLMLDKSQGLVLGSELVDTANTAAAWTPYGSNTVTNDDGAVKITFVGGTDSSFGAFSNLDAAGCLSQNLTGGKCYEISFSARVNSGNSVEFGVRNGTILASATATVTSATYASYKVRFFTLTPYTNVPNFTLNGSFGAGETIWLRDISVRELPGNHAIAFNDTTARPELRARVNLLVATATLSTQNVTTQATSYTLSFAGTGSITLSGTATGSYSAGTHTITCTAGTLTLTVSGAVTTADLRPANSGALLPAYQAVVDANTYDTSGFPLYLRFDGIDDSMYTPANLNLSGTDKVAVFAGVRKLSDAALSFISELSTNAGANAGTFFLTVPGAGGSISRYGALSRGSVAAPSFDANNNFPAPITNVLTLAGDIPADAASIRVNGVQSGSSTADQGAGNYGTYPLFIGSRANSSLWLNGHLYSLIIAGSAVSAGNISATEQWVAGKTGIVIP